MKQFFKHLILLLKRLLLLILLFQLSRLFFFILNFDYFRGITFSDALLTFLFGTRFDISAILLFNCIFIILHVFPGNFKTSNIYQILLKILFFTVNSFILLFNFTDAEYFKFINKRTTYDFFSLINTGMDFWHLLPQFFKDYWYIPLAWLMTLLLAWFLYPKLKFKPAGQNKFKPGRLIVQSILFLFIISLAFIAIRGVQLRPIGIINAANYTKPQFIPLVLNTPFTLYQTYMDKDIKEINYFPENVANKYFNPVNIFQSDSLPRNDNIIIIILESFSNEYIGYMNNNKGSTPFLDSLARQGLTFRNAYANGTRSMEALPAIISGLPALMDNPFVTSQFSSNEITGLPDILKNYGYKSAFFHGGNNGTMCFDHFSRLAGFDEYYGRNEYNNDKNYDGKWGIYDEEFLQYTAKILNTFDQPFFCTIFTLSSHHPYSIPEYRKTQFKNQKHEILSAIAYTDFALKKFFETISKTHWYKNSLFVITADHTSLAFEPYYLADAGRYAIPVVYYHPGQKLEFQTSEIYTQQADIMPSVLDYLNVNEKIISFGNSVFDKKAPHFAINYANNIYRLIENDYLLQFNGQVSIGFYHLKSDSLLTANLLEQKPDIVQIMEYKLKSIIQQFNNRMIKNNLKYRE